MGHACPENMLKIGERHAYVWHVMLETLKVVLSLGYARDTFHTTKAVGELSTGDLRSVLVPCGQVQNRLSAAASPGFSPAANAPGTHRF
jgi:hypothetical protein